MGCRGSKVRILSPRPIHPEHSGDRRYFFREFLPSSVVFFELILGAVGIAAGAVAGVAGFGIGSLLTPTLALQTGTKLAVAAIAIPHFVGTLQRYWILRRHVDRRVLLGF